MGRDDRPAVLDILCDGIDASDIRHAVMGSVPLSLLCPEVLAGLEEVKGRGLHSLRSKFATEMKDTPLRDLAWLRGWKCTNTVVMVYQQPDEETMRAALSRRTTLRSVATGTK